MRKLILSAVVAFSFGSMCVADDDYSEFGSDGVWVELKSQVKGATAEDIVKGLKWGLEQVELTKGYKSPIGAEERAKIVKSVTARHGFIWVPRKLSTVIGRLEEMLGYAQKGLETAEDALKIGKILGIAIGAKNMDDAVEMMVSEGLYQDSAFGEAAYWLSTIAVGMYNGRSFTDAILDGYDEKNIGKWTKYGAKAGGWLANIVNAMPWKKAEREAMDKAFRDSMIRQGINEEGLAVIDRWLALDREARQKVPIIVDPSWFAANDGGAFDNPNPDSGEGGSSTSEDSGSKPVGLTPLQAY